MIPRLDYRNTREMTLRNDSNVSNTANLNGFNPDGFSGTTISCSLVGESTFHIADQAFEARSRSVEHEKHQHIIEPLVLSHGNPRNRCSSGVHDQSILAVPDAA